MTRTWCVSASIVVLLMAEGSAQGPQPPQLMQAPPKPLVANAKAVRSCESLAMVTLPNTTIESAAVDPANPGICRVMAITTHPPAGDKVRIWVGIPTSNWNGRFLGIGGGGFAGGSQGGVNQPAALGYAAGSTDTGHEGGSGSFALDANGRLNWQSIRDNRARRDSRNDCDGQGADAGNVRSRAALFLLERLLDRRTPGSDGGTALSAGLQRHRRRRARNQLEPSSSRRNSGARCWKTPWECRCPRASLRRRPRQPSRPAMRSTA